MAKSRRHIAQAMVTQRSILQDLRASTVAKLSQFTDPVAPTSSRIRLAQAPSSNL